MNQPQLIGRLSAHRRSTDLRHFATGVMPPRGGRRQLPRRVGLMRQLSYASLALLIAMQLLESALQAPPPLVWVMRVLPLLIFLPGMLAGRPRSFIWLCLVLQLYFITLVLRLFAAPDNGLALVAMASLISLFASAMLYVRWHTQAHTHNAGGKQQ